MKLSSPPLILASSSPYRREILTRLGLTFESISPEIDEARLPDESAIELVERLAITKANAIAEDKEQGLVIGSDQVCVLGNQILGKPRDHSEAVKQLSNASGQSARLLNGIALVNASTGEILSEIVSVNVVYRHLSADEIERYLQADQPYNCCGSLKVESRGIALLAAVESDDPNAITGMPVIALLRMLRQSGFTVP